MYYVTQQTLVLFHKITILSFPPKKHRIVCNIIGLPFGDMAIIEYICRKYCDVIRCLMTH